MKKKRGIAAKLSNWFRQRRLRSTRVLLGIDAIREYGLQTPHGHLVYFMVSPTNLSVLSDDSLSARIYALMTILKGQTEIEMLALDSRANFSSNKQYLSERIRKEPVPQIRQLLKKDLAYLDKIQVQTVTAREFLIAVRFHKDFGPESRSLVNQIEKIISEQSFTVHRANKEDIKKLLSIYFEQNVTTEQFEDFDGERWMVLGD